MKYRVSHRTVYSYDQDVSDSLGIAYLVPRQLPWQQVISRELVLAPDPLDQSEDLDYYGNTATYFQVTESHEVLDILATSQVEVSTPVHSDEALGVAWEQARPAARPDVEDSWRALDFALPSSLAEQTPEAHAYAAESLSRGRPLGEAVIEVMRRIHADFTYDKTATTVTTTVDDIFEKRAGVCQDFAHLTLACLRAHGFGSSLCQRLPRHDSASG